MNQDKKTAYLVLAGTFVLQTTIFLVLALLHLHEELWLQERLVEQDARFDILSTNCLNHISHKRKRAEQNDFVLPHSINKGDRRKRAPKSILQIQIDLLNHFCDNSSYFCVPGDTGEIGDKGQRGVTLSKGIRGDQGTKGLPGNTGISGQKGEHGPTGQQGIMGSIGAFGQHGIKGVHGDMGDKGTKGQRSTQVGLPGSKGERGDVGQIGSLGNKGIKGSIGDNGKRGDKGQKGLAGQKGGTGIKGANGIAPPCTCYQKPRLLGPDIETFNVLEGEKLVLKCDVNTSSPLTYEWTYKGSYLLPSNAIPSGDTLTLSNVKNSNNTGSWKCLASTFLDTVKTTFEINVIDTSCNFDLDCSWTFDRSKWHIWTVSLLNQGFQLNDHTFGNGLGRFIEYKHIFGTPTTGAVISSPQINDKKTTSCLRFSYSMYGAGHDRIFVELEQKYLDGTSSVKEIWSTVTTPSSSNKWAEVYIPVTTNSTVNYYKLHIHGSSTERDTSYAQTGLDDIKITRSCPIDVFAMQCSFDKDMCLWSNSKDPKHKLIFAWHNKRSGTPIEAPSTDMTLGSIYSGYAMLSTKNGSNLDTGALVSPRLKPRDDTNLCLFFYVYMSGVDSGTLQVETERDDGRRDILLKLSGQQPKMWIKEKLKVPSRIVKITFEGSRSTGPNGAIAVDEVKVGTC